MVAIFWLQSLPGNPEDVAKNEALVIDAANAHNMPAAVVRFVSSF